MGLICKALQALLSFQIELGAVTHEIFEENATVGAYFFVGEVLSTQELAGFLVVLAGALWHAYEPKSARINGKLLVLMLSCGILIAIFSAGAKRLFLEVRWVDGLFYLYFINK